MQAGGILLFSYSLYTYFSCRKLIIMCHRSFILMGDKIFCYGLDIKNRPIFHAIPWTKGSIHKGRLIKIQIFQRLSRVIRKLITPPPTLPSRTSDFLIDHRMKMDHKGMHMPFNMFRAPENLNFLVHIWFFTKKRKNGKYGFFKFGLL